MVLIWNGGYWATLSIYLALNIPMIVLILLAIRLFCEDND